MKNKNNYGFTLIELLVVVALIGILTAVLLANMVGIRERGADTKIKNDLSQLKTALRMYYNDTQAYPINSGTCEGVLPGTGSFAVGSTVYMKEVPENCEYGGVPNGESFVLWAQLNNTGDPDAAKSATRCGVPPVSGRYFECLD